MLALSLGGKVTPPLGGVLGLLCTHLLHPLQPPTLFFVVVVVILEFLDCFSITVPWGDILIFLAWIQLREGRRCWSVSAQSSVPRPGPNPIPHHVQFIPPSFLFRLEGAEGRKTKRDDRRGPQASEG